MESSSTNFTCTTKFQWSNFKQYTLPTRGEQNVPEQYLKNAKWGYSPYTGTEGYHTNSCYNEDTYFPVEFNFDHLCWVEICWNRQEEHWEAFCLAGADLGIDIPLSETRAGQPDTGRFIGKEPQIFMGDHTKAEEFLTQWNLFVGINLHNMAMQNPYQCCLLFLTYLQGPHINEWVQS